MDSYNIKIVDYGHKEKTTVFTVPVTTGINSSAEKRQNYLKFSEEKKKESDRRRINYYRKKLAEIRDIAVMNEDLNSMITLTFKENITSYKEAVKEFHLAIKRLRYFLKKEDLKYICTWEYQEKRSEKLGITDGGVFHFHFLTNTGFIDHSELEKLWGNGYVWIEEIGTAEKRMKAIGYAVKYSIKEIMKQVEKGMRGMRYIFTSNNLVRPVIKTSLDRSVTIDDVIFQNLENMITDGNYTHTLSDGTIANRMDYAIYKK